MYFACVKTRFPEVPLIYFLGGLKIISHSTIEVGPSNYEDLDGKHFLK
jgi:hypothetical protein